jgi:hypothetical protein
MSQRISQKTVGRAHERDSASLRPAAGCPSFTNSGITGKLINVQTAGHAEREGIETEKHRSHLRKKA